MTIRHTPCGEGQMMWREWGDGPPLLLHGGTGSWRHWTRNIPHFARTRRVLAPDLPGLGDSALPSDATPDGLAAVVAQGVPVLLDGAEYDLVGFSFGGQIAARLAAREDARVRSLTLVGVSALGTQGRPPIVLEKVRKLSGAERVAAHRTNLHRLMIADPARIDDLAVEIQEWNTTRSRLVSRGFAGGTHVRAALAETRAPRVNAIWGGRDQVAEDDLDERIAVVRHMRPDAEVRLIDGAGHWVAYEAPEAFNAMLDGMIVR